ncbi:hypothetical protein [Wenjunlia vitaminophila]|nr:hypothetical protein [Wenjunlia vitaminophila]
MRQRRTLWAPPVLDRHSGNALRVTPPPTAALPGRDPRQDG